MTPSDRPRFRDSAVIVLVRGHGADLETYWVRRAPGVGYMPGFEAFIGGTLSPEDAELPLENAGDDEERLFKACAIREAFEETGVLVAPAAPVAPETLPEARERLLRGATSFPGLAWEHGWRFDARALAFAGRWQTPPFAPTRFDTIYYLARVTQGQEPVVHGAELESGEWIRPADALERWRHGAASFAAPILHTLLALAQGEEGLEERLPRGPGLAAEPVRRIEIRWGFVLHAMVTRPLPPATHTNAYLVGEREMALVDPGSADPGELESLFRLIEQLGAEGRRLARVLLTHHHPDHVAGVEAVRASYGVPVLAHAETGRHLRIDRALADGEEVRLAPGGAGDWNLRALWTPGHTRGHLCFLHPRTRTLLSGDHVPGGRGTVVIDPPEGDMADYLRSLERLLAEPVEYLFPAHGAPQGAAKRRIERLIAHRREREGRVLAALDAEPRDLPALLARAYGDTPRELWRWAERSLLAHLLKLEVEGRAARAGGSWRRPGERAAR